MYKPNSINHADAYEYIIAFESVTKVYHAEGPDAATKAGIGMIVNFNQRHPADEPLRSDQLAYLRGLECGVIFAKEGPAFDGNRTFTLNELHEPYQNADRFNE